MLLDAVPRSSDANHCEEPPHSAARTVTSLLSTPRARPKHHYCRGVRPGPRYPPPEHLFLAPRLSQTGPVSPDLARPTALWPRWPISVFEAAVHPQQMPNRGSVHRGAAADAAVGIFRRCWLRQRCTAATFNLKRLPGAYARGEGPISVAIDNGDITPVRGAPAR
eukprot:scaffold2529_cov363-Prasinococcus_capsulatus_cf.AAC.20